MGQATFDMGIEQRGPRAALLRHFHEIQLVARSSAPGRSSSAPGAGALLHRDFFSRSSGDQTAELLAKAALAPVEF